jgi:hypothetical protein
MGPLLLPVARAGRRERSDMVDQVNQMYAEQIVVYR